MVLTITKEFDWNCAHRLYDSNLTSEENDKMFGKCVNVHGHTYKLFVTIKSKTSELNSGMIINFTELKEIVNRLVIERFDHRLLNDDSLYKDRLTTCENQVEDIWDLLEPELLKINVRVHKIKLYETPTSCATLIR